jgi:hypothetical protein
LAIIIPQKRCDNRSEANEVTVGLRFYDEWQISAKARIRHEQGTGSHKPVENFPGEHAFTFADQPASKC